MDDQMWKNLRGNLKWYRLYHGLSMEAMGKRIGRSREWVNRIESGGRTNRLDALEQVAQGLDTRIRDLVDEEPLSQVDFTKAERRQAARYLEEKRKKLELTTLQISVKAGLSVQYWYRIQKGQQLMSPCKIYQVALALEVPVEEVVRL